MTARDLTRELAERWAATHPETRQARFLRSAPADRRDSIVDAIVLALHAIAGPTLHHGPSSSIAARLALGEHPSEIAPDLTRREACDWARQSEHESPREWLWSRVSGHWQAVLAGVSCPRTIGVVRWVAETCADDERRASLARPRRAAMGEQVVEGRVIDRLDELIDADLRDGVLDTIAAATQRICRERWDGPDELIPAERWHARLPAGVEVIRTFTGLWTEGAEMRHCSAAYARDVADRACLIVSIAAADGTRSTVEVRGGKIAQHRGPRNESPSSACEAVARSVKRWS